MFTGCVLSNFRKVVCDYRLIISWEESLKSLQSYEFYLIYGQENGQEFACAVPSYRLCLANC